MPSDGKTRVRSPFNLDSPLLNRIREVNGKDLDILSEQKWICLHVKAGTELKVAAFLIENRIPFFIPLRLHAKNSVRPLWTNYAFCRVHTYQRNRLKRHHNVERLLNAPDEEELILHLRQFAPVSRILPYEKNDKVKVKTGALEGFIAKVDQVDDEERSVKISINLLGKAVQVSRSYDEVEVLEHFGQLLFLNL